MKIGIIKVMEAHLEDLSFTPDTLEAEVLARRKDFHVVGSQTDAPQAAPEQGGFLAEGGGTNSLDLFFQEAGRHPLLTREQEEDIGRRKEKFVDLREQAHVKAKPGRGKKEDHEEFRRILDEKLTAVPENKKAEMEDSIKALEELVSCNLRWVVSRAKIRRNRGLPFLDLIQEGVVGLIRAAEMFDYKLGNKFSTYSTGWIDQAIDRALADKARTIRLPVHIDEKLKKVDRTSRNLVQELGREPTEAEIADDLDMEVEEILELLEASRPPVALEKPVDDASESEFGQFIEDKNAERPGSHMEKLMRDGNIQLALKRLPEHERQVIVLRFGFLGEVMTYEEVGEELGITRYEALKAERAILDKLGSFREVQYLAPDGLVIDEESSRKKQQTKAAKFLDERKKSAEEQGLEYVVLGDIVDKISVGKNGRGNKRKLNDKENAVALLIEDGLLNKKAVAKELDIPENTVKSIVSRLRQSLKLPRAKGQSYDDIVAAIAQKRADQAKIGAVAEESS